MSIDLKITRARYYESSVHDGQPEYHETTEALYEDFDLSDAITFIRNEGLTFEATGNLDVAGQPDGSRTVDYGTAEQEEVFVIVVNAKGWEHAALIAGVDYAD